MTFYEELRRVEGLRRDANSLHNEAMELREKADIVEGKLSILKNVASHMIQMGISSFETNRVVNMISLDEISTQSEATDVVLGDPSSYVVPDYEEELELDLETHLNTFEEEMKPTVKRNDKGQFVSTKNKNN